VISIIDLIRLRRALRCTKARYPLISQRYAAIPAKNEASESLRTQKSALHRIIACEILM